MFGYSWLMRIYLLSNRVSCFQFTVSQLILGRCYTKQNIYWREILMPGDLSGRAIYLDHTVRIGLHL